LCAAGKDSARTGAWRGAFFAALILLTGSAPLQAGQDGLALITATWDRYRSVKSEREESEILVVSAPQSKPFSRADAEALARDGGPGVVHKRAVRHVLDEPDHQDKLHILFSLPPEDAGLGFLVWRQPDGARDEMWLYMPGYDSVRRVPLSSKQRLAGTDFLYEDVRDLSGERTGSFTYETLSSEQVDGRTADVILAKPKSDTVTAYSNRKIWVDTEWLFPLRVEFYDAHDRLWKVLHNSDVREVAPGVYRANLVEMRDLQRNEATVILVTKRTAGVDIPLQVFTQSYLVRPGSD
jgi:hypothetical protein